MQNEISEGIASVLDTVGSHEVYLSASKSLQSDDAFTESSLGQSPGGKRPQEVACLTALIWSHRAAWQSMHSQLRALHRCYTNCLSKRSRGRRLACALDAMAACPRHE